MRAILTLVLFLVTVKTANCQPYSFSTSTDVYTPLTGAISVNGSTVWSYATSFSVPIGFTFNFMGNNYTNIFVEGGGFTYFDAGYNYIILPFGVALKDKGTASTLSPISYRLDGSSPNRILKIEWNNADYFNNPGSTANFQLWLYESVNIIETHVGSCSILSPSSAYSWNSDNGPSIGIYEFSGSNCIYGFGLTGSTIFPTENNNLSGTGINVFGYSLNSTPSGDQVYSFAPAGTTIDENSFTANELSLYYAGTSDNIVYKSTNEVIENIYVYDVAGRSMLQVHPGNRAGEIHVGGLIDHSGIYIVQFKFANKEIISRKLFLLN